MQVFPKWFIQLSEKLNKNSEAKKLFTQLDAKTNGIATDLITIFGTLNRQTIKFLLSTNINLADKYEKEFDRLQKVQKIYLSCLIKKSTKNEIIVLLESDKLYKHVAAISSKDTWTFLVSDVTKYLAASGMPAQKMKFLGLDSVDWIKTYIDNYDIKLQKSITSLFEKTKTDHFSNFSYEEEGLLFKHIAIKSYDGKKSWGYLVYAWLMLEDLQNPFLLCVKRINFYKILIKSIDLQLGSGKKSKIPFSKWLIQQTIAALCYNKKSHLPNSSFFQAILLQLFSSEIIRQDINGCILHLHKRYEKNEWESFFDDALAILNRLVPDKSTEVYNFLHAVLHYFHCLHQNSTEIEARNFLFEKIYSLSYTRRRKYDKKIIENDSKSSVSQEQLIINKDFLQFAKNHPLSNQQWGEIILRFSQSNRNVMSLSPSPNLSPQKHFELIKKIEQFLNTLLPTEIIALLLYFQNAQEGILQFLDEFSEVRAEIIQKHLNDLSISPELYHKWEMLSCSFLELFSLKIPEDLLCLNSQGDSLIFFLGGITILLQFVTYPKPRTSFFELIPSTVYLKDQQFIFTNETSYLFDQYFKQGTQVINCLRPIYPEFVQGPSWLVRWIFKDGPEAADIIVTLMNPSQNNCSCVFQLSVEIPNQTEEETALFFKLLSSLVDGLGKEALSDEEMLKLGTNISQSSETLNVEDTPEKQFEYFLSCSPLLQSPFEEFINSTNVNPSVIKEELFEFVRLLRTNFLRTFYFILNPEEMQNILIDRCIGVILPCSEGLYLSNAWTFSLSNNENSLFPKIVIKKDDYFPQFQEIYKTLCSSGKESSECYNFLLRVESDASLDVSFLATAKLKIDYLYKNYDIEEEMFSENKIIEDTSTEIIQDYKSILYAVQITMSIPDGDHHVNPLTIQRLPFQNEKEFLDHMLWQTALFCNDNKSSWL